MAKTAVNHDLGTYGAAIAFVVPAGKHFVGRIMPYLSSSTGVLSLNGKPWVELSGVSTLLSDLKPIVLKAGDTVSWTSGSVSAWLTGFLYDN